MEPFYPLHVYVCEAASWCSSRSTSRPEASSATTPISPPIPTRWLESRQALRARRWSSGSASRRSPVVEVASNDGYLLQYFVQVGIVPLGIEPAANVAAAAERRACRRASSSSDGVWPGRLVATRRHGRPPRGQQCAGPRAGPQRTSWTA